MQKQKNKTFVLRLMSLFVIVLVISAAAILRDGKLLGHDMGEALATSAAVAVDNDTLEGAARWRYCCEYALAC